MGLKFSEAQGSAAKTKVDLYEYKEGEQSYRMVGNILPRYLYWVPTKTAGKELPVECLSFDRDKEKFTNIEVDHVLSYFPLGRDGKPNRPQWSYTIMAIDPKDGKCKPVPLKKKMLADVIDAAKDLQLDPTDPDTGFDIVFKKTKTGPQAYNVEYKLSILKLKSRPLTEEERKAVAEAKTIDQIYPRPTPEEVKAQLEKIVNAVADEGETPAGTDTEAVADL